jgi:hypothetical protein
MTRRAHSRSGTHVKAFSRNGSWVNSHYRNGTDVTESCKLSPKQLAANLRNIDAYFTPLVYQTQCFWCSSKVFFYRSENGGCALFDQLGWPWSLHHCWEKYRQPFKQRVAIQLSQNSFDGHVYYQERQRASKPQKSDVVSMIGFVDRSELRRRVQFPSCRGAISGVFRVVNFVPEDKLNVFYELLVPEIVAEDFPQYSIHEVTGNFLKYKHRWLCILSKFRRLSASSKAGKFRRNFIQIDQTCHLCGSILDDNKWGFGTNFALECNRCGMARGRVTTQEFIEYISSCYTHQKRRGQPAKSVDT